MAHRFSYMYKNNERKTCKADRSFTELIVCNDHANVCNLLSCVYFISFCHTWSTLKFLFAQTKCFFFVILRFAFIRMYDACCDIDRYVCRLFAAKSYNFWVVLLKIDRSPYHYENMYIARSLVVWTCGISHVQIHKRLHYTYTHILLTKLQRHTRHFVFFFTFRACICVAFEWFTYYLHAVYVSWADLSQQTGRSIKSAQLTQP